MFYPFQLALIIFPLGLLVGLPIAILVDRLPEFLARKWERDSAEYLGLPSTISSKSEYISLRPNEIFAKVIIIAFLTGLLSAWVTWHYGLESKGIAALILVWGMLIMSLIDLDHQLLPDILVLPLLWLGLIVNSFGLFTTVHNALWGAVMGYLPLWFFLRLQTMVSGIKAMGEGDLKLLAMLGAWGGWQILPTTVVLSSVAFAVVGGTLFKLGKIKRSTPMPFGPFLATAGWLALLYTPG